MDFLGGEDRIINDGTLTLLSETVLSNLEAFTQTAARETLTIQIDLDSTPTFPIVDFGGAEFITSVMTAIHIDYAGDWQPSRNEPFTLFGNVTLPNDSTDGFVVTQSHTRYTHTLSADADQGTITVTPTAMEITTEYLERQNITTIPRDSLAFIGSDVNVGLGGEDQEIIVQSGATLIIESGAVVNLGEGSDSVKVLSGATLIVEDGAVLNLGDDDDIFINSGSLTIEGRLLLGDGDDELNNSDLSDLTIKSGGVVNLGEGSDSIKIFPEGTVVVKDGGVVNLGEGSDSIKIFPEGAVTVEDGGVVNLGDDADIFTNAGALTVVGGLLLGDGDDELNNSDSSDLTIESGGVVNLGEGADSIKIFPGETVIMVEGGGVVNLGEGADSVKIFPGRTVIVKDGAVLNLGDDADTFINSGSLTIAGRLLLGDGHDEFDNSGDRKRRRPIRGAT